MSCIADINYNNSIYMALGNELGTEREYTNGDS